MKFKSQTCSRLIVFSCILAHMQTVSHAQSASDIRNILNKIDKDFSNTTFVWDAKHSIKFPETPQSNADQMLKKGRESANRHLDELGIKDASERNRYIESTLDSIRQMAATTAVTTSSTYKYERNPNIIHVHEEHLPSNVKVLDKEDSYYLDGAAIYAPLVPDMGDGVKYGAQFPIVVGSNGPAIYRYLGDGKKSKINPFVSYLLCNTNPLNIVNSSWKLSKEDGKHVQFDTQVIWEKQGEFKFSITLDKHREYACESIRIFYPTMTFEYRVDHYRKIAGHWCPDEITEVTQKGFTETQHWSLQSTSKSEIVAIKVPIDNDDISDIRLNGNELSMWDTLAAQDYRNPNTVQYRWKGKLPTLDELRKLRSKQHPTGIAMMGTNSKYLLFIPGVLLIGTGIFLKLRKSRKEKATAFPAANK